MSLSNVTSSIAVPEYKLTIPSNQQTITFRPFLTKEQKVMLIALESQDIRQITNSLITTVSNCCNVPYDVSELATFDLEYIFTQIRAKSVGETTQITVECDKCSHNNVVGINLESIEVDMKSSTKQIKINDEISLTMRYPTYKRLENLDIDGLSNAEKTWETIKICVESVETEDDSIIIDDCPPDELENFLNMLNTEQFEKLTDWLDNMPTLSKTVEYKCAECGKDHKLELKGIYDFF